MDNSNIILEKSSKQFCETKMIGLNDKEQNEQNY